MTTEQLIEYLDITLDRVREAYHEAHLANVEPARRGPRVQKILEHVNASAVLIKEIRNLALVNQFSPSELPDFRQSASR